MDIAAHHFDIVLEEMVGFVQDAVIDIDAFLRSQLLYKLFRVGLGHDIITAHNSGTKSPRIL